MSYDINEILQWDYVPQSQGNPLLELLYRIGNLVLSDDSEYYCPTTPRVHRKTYIVETLYIDIAVVVFLYP